MTAAAEFLFANGTTALAAALVAMGCRGRLVAVPAAVCPSVPAAVLAAGATPLLVDIERDTLGLCPDALAAMATRVAGVVAVHAYGVPCRLAALRAVCQTHGLPLIEDCAQAEGAVGTGDQGDIRIYSYGTGKILDLGGGGRAVTADPVLAGRLSAFAAALSEPEDAHAGDELGQVYKFLYNRYFPGHLAPYRFIMPRLMAEAGARQLGRADEALAARIAIGRAGLAAETAARRAKADRYRQRLGALTGLDFLPCPETAAPWRFNVAIDPARRDPLFKALLAEGRRVSTWYPSAALFMGTAYTAGMLPVAEWLGSVILNLPLDSATTQTGIDVLCARIAALLEAP